MSDLDLDALEQWAEVFERSGTACGYGSALISAAPALIAAARERDALRHDLDRALKFAKDVWETDDPSEPIADNGMTIWNDLQRRARSMGERSEREETSLRALLDKAEKALEEIRKAKEPA